MRLDEIFQELNLAHFQAELPVPKLAWNSRLSSTAGRFCPGSRHLLRPRAALIEVATYLRDLPDGLTHVRDTVLHEMIHYYLWVKQRPHGHTAEFHRILKKVGAKRYNTVPKERAFRHWYECPNCRHGFHTRRKLGLSACARCCRNFNRGQFHERFRLQRLPPKPEGTLRPPSPAPAAAPTPLPEPARASASPPPPEHRLNPGEIIRRLEELKRMVQRR